MNKKKKTDFDRFVGKWVLKTSSGNTTIEFLKGGAFNYFNKKRLFQKLIMFNEEYHQKFRLYNTIKISPTWDIKKGKLKILFSNKEQYYEYNFSNDDNVLNLTKIGTNENLSFYKDSSGSSIGSTVSWYLKFQIMFAVFFMFLFGSLIYFVFSLNIHMLAFVFIAWGLVFFVLAVVIYVWLKKILPKLKSKFFLFIMLSL